MLRKKSTLHMESKVGKHTFAEWLSSFDRNEQARCECRWNNDISYVPFAADNQITSHNGERSVAMPVRVTVLACNDYF